ncbi:MAG: hypothetical protein ABIO83_11520, partial [Ilumatobacteraceae bacterium]
MSDDIWRDRRDDDDYSEFGSLFDDAEPTENLPEIASPTRDDAPADRNLSFGDGGTGSLPHWTEPPTGEVPRLDSAAKDEAPVDDEHADLDVWSSFSSESPVWKDDEVVADDPAATTGRITGQQRRVADRSERVDRVTGQQRR